MTIVLTWETESSRSTAGAQVGTSPAAGPASVTEIVEIPDRGHALVIDRG